MSDEKQSADLSPLLSDYDLVGELSIHGPGRTYIATRKDPGAKRREDDTRVLITVVETPQGDEGNALSHLAADTKQLSSLKHRRLVPVVEGRWLGKDAYAVVTQRTTDPSLLEKLATGETFSTPRTAAILREVNGLIEWAREQNIRHRGVTPDGIFLEPRTDRVRVSFSVAPISRIQRSDAAEDARTIARLAIAMLTGNPDARATEGKSIHEFRPELPTRLGEETTALIDEASEATEEDVATYIALVGMADPLYAGESFEKKIREEILEEQRAEREKLANERTEFETLMADERAKFQQEMAAERAAFEAAMAEERARLEKIMSDDRARLAAEKAELQRAVKEERAALLAQRTGLEKADAERRAQVEAAAAADRKQIEKLRAELMAAGESEIEKKRNAALEEVTDEGSVLEDEEFAAPLFMPLLGVPLPELEFDQELPLLQKEEPIAVPELDPPKPFEEAVEDKRHEADPWWKRKWFIPSAIAAGILVVGGGIAMNARSSSAPPPVQPPVVASAQPAAAQPVNQVPASVVPLPSAAIVDSAAGGISANAADTTRERRALREGSAPKPKPSIVRERPSAPTDSLFAIPTAPRPRPDAQARRDSVRRDSLARRDSIRPDTATSQRM